MPNTLDVKHPTYFRFLFFIALAFALGIGVGLATSALQVSLIAFVLLIIAVLTALYAGRRIKQRTQRLQKMTIRQ